jgi:hypothetical protein
VGGRCSRARKWQTPDISVASTLISGRSHLSARKLRPKAGWVSRSRRRSNALELLEPCIKLKRATRIPLNCTTRVRDHPRFVDSRPRSCRCKSALAFRKPPPCQNRLTTELTRTLRSVCEPAHTLFENSSSRAPAHRGFACVKRKRCISAKVSLAELGNHRLRFPFLPEVGQQQQNRTTRFFA